MSEHDESSTQDYVCYGCDRTFQSTPDDVTMLTRGAICEDCVCTCVRCENLFNLNSGSIHANLDDGVACYRCTSQYFNTCDNCGDWEHRDNMRHTGHGGDICDYCSDHYYSYCDSCDNLWHEDDEHSCRGYHRSILSYSEKPTPIFYHLDSEFDNAKVVTKETPNVLRRYRQIPYLGFELEVECVGNGSDFTNGAEIFSGYKPIYLKEDGSIRRGFEIVSHPMTLGWAMQNFEWDKFVELEANEFSAWNQDTVGIHVHVSRDGFVSDVHQAKFVHFIFRNEEFLSWLVGRGSTHYSRYDKDQLRRLGEKIRRRRSSDRYMAVNLNNQATLEVRIFQSSLEPDRIKMNLQLVDAILKYSQTLTTSDMVSGSGFEPKSFIQWVFLNQETYPQLFDYSIGWISKSEHQTLPEKLPAKSGV